MTNRKDLIDVSTSLLLSISVCPLVLTIVCLFVIQEALLRPGRLEVHIEIGLPDEKGREQILKIHTAKMTEGKQIAFYLSLYIDLI